jgi:hypothetical protein
MAGDAYPNDRPKYFAHKFVRILTRTCAAMEIGTDGFCLLSIIAHTEDAAHYRSPVTYWNDQLLPITGLGTWGRLDRARKKAVRAGWLHYEPGGKGKVGKYWVTIPSQYEGLPDGSVAEDDPVILATSEEENREDNQLSSPPVEKEPWDNRGTTVGQPGDNRGTSAEHPKPTPSPVPDPVPDPKKRARSIDADADADAALDPFDLFWNVVHHKVGKQAAREKFNLAVRRIRADKTRDLGSVTPQEFLIERMRLFAASPAANPTTHSKIHPERWLNRGRYDDDPATWQEDGSSQAVAQAPMINPKDYR